MIHSSTLTPISTLGEFALIKHLTNTLKNKNESTLKGIGDDAAVIDNNNEMATLISSDMLLEGIHFDLMYVSMKNLGYKSVAVNVSDIYAMNGTPQQITVSLGLSSKFTVEALEELYEGIKEACLEYEVDLVGGDTCSSMSGLVISITVLGTAPKNEIIYRNGAKENDLICVSGNLGAAFLGLQLLEREKRLFVENANLKPNFEDKYYLLQRQLKPKARKDIISILKNFNIHPTSMIDVSDGLSSDLLHICTQSKVGCQIFEENVPICEEAKEMAKTFNISPSTAALNGGEDYELLFTIDKSYLEIIEEMEHITIIGNILPASEGYNFYSTGNNKYPLTAQGWKHI